MSSRKKYKTHHFSKKSSLPTVGKRRDASHGLRVKSRLSTDDTYWLTPINNIGLYEVRSKARWSLPAKRTRTTEPDKIKLVVTVVVVVVVVTAHAVAAGRVTAYD